MHIEVTHADDTTSEFDADPSTTVAITDSAGTARTFALQGVTAIALCDGPAATPDPEPLAVVDPGDELSAGGKVLQDGKTVTSTGGKLTLTRADGLATDADGTPIVEPPILPPVADETDVAAPTSDPTNEPDPGTTVVPDPAAGDPVTDPTSEPAPPAGPQSEQPTPDNQAPDDSTDVPPVSHDDAVTNAQDAIAVTADVSLADAAEIANNALADVQAALETYPGSQQLLDAQAALERIANPTT